MLPLLSQTTFFGHVGSEVKEDLVLQLAMRGTCHKPAKLENDLESTLSTLAPCMNYFRACLLAILPGRIQSQSCVTLGRPVDLRHISR